MIRSRLHITLMSLLMFIKCRYISQLLCRNHDWHDLPCKWPENASRACIKCGLQQEQIFTLFEHIWVKRQKRVIPNIEITTVDDSVYVPCNDTTFGIKTETGPPTPITNPKVVEKIFTER
jgi:hypothetical protein